MKIDTLAMNVDPDDVLELTNATMMNLTRTSIDPANDCNWTDNEDEIEDINPKRNAVIRQIGK